MAHLTASLFYEYQSCDLSIEETGIKEVGALPILISLQICPQKRWILFVTTGLVLSWNWFGLNVQLHGNCSHIPTWIYVKAPVCHPRSTKGTSYGPSWNSLAHSITGLLIWMRMCQVFFQWTELSLRWGQWKEHHAFLQPLDLQVLEKQDGHWGVPMYPPCCSCVFPII